MDKVLSLLFADWFVKIQPAISHIFLFFFFEGVVGQRGPGRRCFSKPVNATFSSQAQKFLLLLQKKRTNKPFSCQLCPAGNVTALSQWNKACLVSVLSKGLLIQTKEKYSHLEGVVGRGWEWRKQSSDGKS